MIRMVVGLVHKYPLVSAGKKEWVFLVFFVGNGLAINFLNEHAWQIVL